jgi:Putative restriction endonuclease
MQIEAKNLSIGIDLGVKTLAQADKSFCLGEVKSIPDLSIEVVYTRAGSSKLPKYQALGVPEVWFWEDGTLRLDHLREEGYEEVVRSELSGLEMLDLELLKRCILMGETNFAEAVKVFQQEIAIAPTKKPISERQI